MKNNILGNILKLYRKPSMSIEYVAQKVGRDAGDIKKWENGYEEPSIYTKALIASLYNIPLNLLTYDYSKEVSANINCRAVGDFRNLSKEYQFIFASKVDNLRSFLELAKTLSSKDDMRIEQNKFIKININDKKTLTEAESIDENVKQIILKTAYTFREYIGVDKTGHIQNLIKKMLEDTAVIVFSQMPEGYSGVSFVSNEHSDFYIFINSGDHYCKQTFTLLHEFAHVIFKDVDNEILIEEYANCFANFVLLPSEDIHQRFKDFSLNNIEKYKKIFEDVSKEYEVGYKTIIYSLLHNGLINKDDLAIYNEDFADYIILKYFNKEYNVAKEAFMTNEYLNILLRRLIDTGHISSDFAIQMNFGKPFIN